MQESPPCRDSENEGLDRLISTAIDTTPFQGAVRHLQSRFASYVATCPAPLTAADLIVTPEIRVQSELYLPVAEIRAVFTRLYQSALRYSPILSSTPFYNALSWADAFNSLPTRFQFSANPARLLEALLTDGTLLTEFLFASFLPRRFYGGFARYPLQQEFIRNWLQQKNLHTVRCLDAACGTGEGTYGVARLLMDSGYRAESVLTEGWTLEPLEVWAARARCFPHDRTYEQRFRDETDLLFTGGYLTRISFRTVDLTDPLMQTADSDQRDLILCNGLLGGPILHDTGKLQQVISTLAELLVPGGILLAADNFHAGWKQHCPHENLCSLLEQCGLNCCEAGEGISGSRSYDPAARQSAHFKVLCAA
ncbi:MAG TPA: chemotaxis protein CheR [Desulfuromonadales bacterium]|nr:chemotaxis protein CheR [Desulfuromonadales bacterium]